MNNVTESWKNSKVFQKQLELNLKELTSKNAYPPHWNDFLRLINKYKPKNILDVGCGCGALYKLLNNELPSIEYYGVDYSEEAIEIAKKTWGKDRFSIKNYLSLDKEYVSKFDLLHLGALLDVLPNGDEALEYIMSISPKSILIGRMKLTDKDSYSETYKAYDEITTFAFYHNTDNFLQLCKKYGYVLDKINNNIYLKRI
jgi:trans-aconitate methyltransferase